MKDNMKQLKSDEHLGLLYLTEVSKSDIFSGLGKVQDKYKATLQVIKDKNNIVDTFNKLTEVEDDITPKAYKFIYDTLKRLDLSDKDIKRINLHEIVINSYSGRELENSVQGFDTTSGLTMGQIFYAKLLDIIDAIRNNSLQTQYYYWPNGAEFWEWNTGSLNESVKKNILAAFDKLHDIRDPNNPVNQLAYGRVSFDYDGIFLGTKSFGSKPIKLPPDCVYVAKGAFIKRGQKPDYRDTYPYVFITDKNLFNLIADTLGEEEFTTNETTVNFMRELYKNLRIDGERDPILPQ